jgi:hypothetical protein
MSMTPLPLAVAMLYLVIGVLLKLLVGNLL